MEIRTQSLVVRLTRSPAVIRDIQNFRAAGFDCGSKVCDADRFDTQCRHIVVTKLTTGRLVACFRVLELDNGQRLNHCYAHQFYDLGRLSAFKGPILELGRFYAAPGGHIADAIRLIWAMVTRLVDQNAAKMLIGCTSFSGTDVARHQQTFGLLAAQHLGPERWRPGIKSTTTVPLATTFPKPSAKQLPPLLRSYLAMGGWVSDHAVVDHDLSTIHVFTALEVRNIPVRRSARLRQLAA